MKKHGILNSNISKTLVDLGHTDQITIGDCGLPVPLSVPKIDLALTLGVPSFLTVLEAVVGDMQVEKIILAEEIQTDNSLQLAEIEKMLPGVSIEFISHDQFKKQTQQSKAIIRTGEATPYSNIILQSGVIF